MRDERGAATVELALFAMFLVMIVSGIVDLGRGMYTAIALNDAVQEGAMYAAFTEDVAGTAVSTTDIVARVVSSTDSPALEAGDVTVSCVPKPRDRQPSSRITVEVAHTVDLITPFISDWFGGAHTLVRSATSERFFGTCPTGSGS